MHKMKVYTHPDLNILAGHFAQRIRTKPEMVELLAPEYLVIQTPGMRRWLTLACARENSVFAHAKIMMPREFIMHLGARLGIAKDERNLFDRDILPWAIYRILLTGLEKKAKELEEIRKYLGDDPQDGKLFPLAQKIADVLDQYVLYRPDWIEKWQEGKRAVPQDPAELWQRYLWTELVRNMDSEALNHQASVAGRLGRALERLTEEEKKKLPRRVSMFGFSLLPPRFLRVFSKLGEVIDLTLHLQVPTLHYTGDLLSDRQIQWRERNAKTFSGRGLAKVFTENRLLRNFGMTSKEFMDMLLEAADVTELYAYNDTYQADHEPTSLLKKVQEDILLCNQSAEVPQAVPEKNWSIRLASCKDPLREVEVLHDILLDRLAIDSTLTPSDILILSPDLNTYAPYLQVVFGNAEQVAGVRIPIAFADRSVITKDPVARLAKDLLESVSGRFEVSILLPLFDRVQEMKGISLSTTERERLARWCAESGMRWGYDGEFKARLGIPGSEEFTFRHGIERLVAGYLMDDEEPLANHLYPAIGAEGTSAETLGTFADLVDTLARFARDIQSPRTFAQWDLITNAFLAHVLPAEGGDDSDERSISAVESSLAGVREQAALSGMTERVVPFTDYLESLLSLLGATDGGNGMFTGKATVADMLPMRSVPFKVIALLGMNRNLFPRQVRRPLFDMMETTEKRRGDRNQLQNDRYLFLESILSAQDALIITWTSATRTSPQDAPPSVLVSELTDHLDREYRLAEGLKAGEGVTVKYPLQPFSPRYRSASPVDKELVTWNRAWFRVKQTPGRQGGIFQWKNTDAPHAERDIVDGEVIIRTLSDPLGSFLDSCRIGVRDRLIHLEDTEPFEIENLDAWSIRNALGEEQLGGKQFEIERLRAKGTLPSGVAGVKAITGQQGNVLDIVKRVKAIQKDPDFQQVSVVQQSGDLIFLLQIPSVSLMGSNDKNLRLALFAEYGKMHERKLLRFWIRHLFLNLESATETKVVATDKTETFRALKQNEALVSLLDLNQLTKANAITLLPFIPAVSLPLAESQSESDNAHAKAWQKLKACVGRNPWENHLFDPRIRDAFGDPRTWQEAMEQIEGGEQRFIDVAHRVFGPMLASRGEA